MILERLGGALEATHAHPRLLLVSHPADRSRRDGFWLVGGRLADWGALPDEPAAALERTLTALRKGGRAGELGAHVPPDELDEVRIVATYLASRPQLPWLALDPPPSLELLKRFLGRSAERQLDDHRVDPTAGVEPGAGLGLAPDEGERDRTESRGQRGAPNVADLAVAEPQRGADFDGR